MRLYGYLILFLIAFSLTKCDNVSAVTDINNTSIRNTGIYFNNVANITIQNNTILDCKNTEFDAGITLENCVNITIFNNTIINNNIGILLINCSQIVITMNIVENNTKYGIVLIGSGNNSIYRNVFINQINGYCINNNIPNHWNNSYAGNYWSDYQVKVNETSNSSGIWKNPYIIHQFVNVNDIDYFPLMDKTTIYTILSPLKKQEQLIAGYNNIGIYCGIICIMVLIIKKRERYNE